MKQQLTQSDLKIELKRGLSGGYLFYGPENYLALHYCMAARDAMSDHGKDSAFGYRRLDAALSEDPLGELYDSMTSLSGFGGRRLVIVNGLDIDHLKQSEFDTLISCAEYADETTVLILRAQPELLDVGYLPKRPSAKFTALCEVLRPVAFEYETPARLNKWVTQHFAASLIICEPAQSSALIECCGRDMSTLNNEIAKLCAYIASQGRNRVTDEDIALLAVRSREVGAFDFSNAITEGNTAEALLLLDEMKRRKEKPEIILATITHVISDLVVMASLADTSVTAEEIAKKTKIHEFKQNIYRSRLRSLSPDHAQKALAKCLETDALVKTSSLDPYGLIRRLICEL